MSCLEKIDPYNNAPITRKGSGCSSGGCGAVPAIVHQQPRPQPQQQQVPQYTGARTTEMSQRPMQTPGRPDLQTENMMLHSDLQTAIGYIRRLGGSWPPS